MQKLASCDNEVSISLQIVLQATEVKSFDSTLFTVQDTIGFHHVILQRGDQKIVVDTRLRPGELIHYAVADRRDAKDCDLQWHTFSAPLIPPVPASPLQKTIRKLKTAFQSALRTILVCNLLVALPTLYYFFLPRGTVIDDENLFVSWLLPLSLVVLLIGIPWCIGSILLRRASGKRYAAEVVALLLCFTPIFLALGMHMLAGATRHLQLPCAGEDGVYKKWTEGC